MRFVLASIVMLAMLFGCASYKSNISNVVPASNIDCTDAFAKIQSFGKGTETLGCSPLSTANGWENHAGVDSQYKDTDMFCKGRVGSSSGENANYFYYSGFVIIKNTKDIDANGVIKSTENKEYLVTNLILKPIGQRTASNPNDANWKIYYMDYEVVSAQCKVAQK